MGCVNSKQKNKKEGDMQPKLAQTQFQKTLSCDDGDDPVALVPLLGISQSSDKPVTSLRQVNIDINETDS